MFFVLPLIALSLSLPGLLISLLIAACLHSRMLVSSHVCFPLLVFYCLCLFTALITSLIESLISTCLHSCLTSLLPLYLPASTHCFQLACSACCLPSLLATGIFCFSIDFTVCCCLLTLLLITAITAWICSDAHCWLCFPLLMIIANFFHLS